MSNTPLHYLRCLRALGYTIPVIAREAHPDVQRWEKPGHVPDPEAVEALMAFYRWTGERVATTATTGTSQSAIAKARAKALAAGCLPPFAYDEDDETGEHTTPHPEAIRNDVSANGRSDDRIATTALTVVARAYLGNPDATLSEISRTQGIQRIWEDVAPLGLTEIRIQDPKDIVLGRSVLDKARARKVWDAVAAVDAGEDPLEVWAETTGAPFQRALRPGIKQRAQAA